jgi:hypothetical protein
VDKLEDKVFCLKNELDLEKAKSGHFKSAFLEKKKNIEIFNDLLKDLEESSLKALQDENTSWDRLHRELKV